MKNKCEHEGDLDLFLNGPNLTWNEIIIRMVLIKALFFTSYSPEGISLCFEQRVP